MRNGQAALLAPLRSLAHAGRSFAKSLARNKDAVESAKNLALTVIAIAAPFVASSFEHRISGTTLLSQREQAESQLRATMFSDLISPVVGGRESGELDPEREALLSELLTINFHEHIELKPLLQHVYDRATSVTDSAKSREIRESLRSIARRVKDRQIATLFAEGHSAGRSADVWEIYASNRGIDTVKVSTRRCYLAGFSQNHLLQMKSPDGNHSVTLWTTDPDWDEDTIHMNVVVMETRNDETVEMNADFVLTPFDFPMTDNTRLDDGNRFAVVVANTRDETDTHDRFRLKLIWFPKGYVMPHERPLNFRDLQLLGKGRG
jgi:hypothetical protein